MVPKEPYWVSSEIHHEYRLSKMQRWVQRTLKAVANRTALFNPFIYLLYGLGLIVVGFFVAGRDRGLCFCLSSCGVSYELTLFFAAGTPDYRYSHWLVTSVWLAALCLASVRLATPPLYRRAGSVLSTSPSHAPQG